MTRQLALYEVGRGIFGILRNAEGGKWVSRSPSIRRKWAYTGIYVWQHDMYETRENVQWVKKPKQLTNKASKILYWVLLMGFEFKIIINAVLCEK